ncbi:MAG: type II toxin-antitoxin system RelE/ParE family toxin, partial [Deltaproteobacteria bacterium]|nr:type II toxin-antitoxin system RelE/ParE family toxin [Deltaproteobacteria bacterium]
RSCTNKKRDDSRKDAKDAKARQTLKRLERFPRSGRRIPEFPELPHREVIVSPYRFFYRIQGDIVWIVAVWRGAQIPGSPRSL